MNRIVLANEQQALGVGRNNHRPDSDFDSLQLQVGILVEHEHSDNPEVARAIAKDHLSEHPDYYTVLIKSGLVDEPIPEELLKQLGLK